MARQLHNFETDICGGVLLIEPELLSSLDEAVLYRLSIAIDVDGKTDLTFDFAGESWQAVWERETQPLVSMVQNGLMSLVVTNEGRYVVEVDIQSGTFNASEDFSVDTNQVINVTKGKLSVFEVGSLLETKFSGEEPEPAFTFNLPNGSYIVKFSRLDGSQSSGLSRMSINLLPFSSSGFVSKPAPTRLPYLKLN